MRTVLARLSCSAVVSLLLALAACRASAQNALPGTAPGTASIVGRVADSTGVSVRFATIWLVPRDTTRPSRAALTDTAGGFAFERLPAADYYLRVDRVGYDSEWSDRKGLGDGQRMRLVVTSAPRRSEVPRLRQPGTCRAGRAIAGDSALARLWREATKAATARRLFDLSHNYSVKVVEEIRGVFGYGRRALKRIVSTPAEARALAQRGSFAGFGAEMDSTRLVAVSEMLELLSDRFSTSHCIAVLPDRHGRRIIHFQPLQPSAVASDLVGNVYLDDHMELRRIDFEYVRGQIGFSRGYVDFGAGGLHDSPIRFVKHVSVQVWDRPVAGLGSVVTAPRAASRGQVANAWIWYGNFRRDATAP